MKLAIPPHPSIFVFAREGVDEQMERRWGREGSRRGPSLSGQHLAMGLPQFVSLK